MKQRAGPKTRVPPGQLARRLAGSIREGDERKVEDAVLQLSRTRKVFAPLALAVGGLVMIFIGLRLLVTNWRLMLVQMLPALLIWSVTLDLKAHVLHGKEFEVVRGPLLVVVFVAVVLLAAAAFFLDATFAFAVSRPGHPRVRTGFQEARDHFAALACWGTGIGLALGVAAVLAPRWGLRWYTILLGTVLGVMLVCFVAVPARLAGVPKSGPAKTARSRRDKLVTSAISGAMGTVLCIPPYLISRAGLALLDTTLLGFGVALLAIGMALEAGAIGAVHAIKMSIKLVRRHPPITEYRPAGEAGRSSGAGTTA